MGEAWPGAEVGTKGEAGDCPAARRQERGGGGEPEEENCRH